MRSCYFYSLFFPAKHKKSTEHWSVGLLVFSWRCPSPSQVKKKNSKCSRWQMISAAANYHYSLSHLTKGQNETLNCCFSAIARKREENTWDEVSNTRCRTFSFFFSFDSCFSRLLQMATAGGSRSGSRSRSRSWLRVDQQCRLQIPDWNTNLWLGEVADSARPSSAWTLCLATWRVRIVRCRQKNYQCG